MSELVNRIVLCPEIGVKAPLAVLTDCDNRSAVLVDREEAERLASLINENRPAGSPEILVWDENGWLIWNETGMVAGPRDGEPAGPDDGLFDLSSDLFVLWSDAVPETLKPVTLLLDRVGYVKFFVLAGTALRGWNAAFFTPADAKFLFENYESSLGLAPSVNADADEEDWVTEGVLRVYELPEPNENGLVELLFCFESGGVAYDYAWDDPERDPN